MKKNHKSEFVIDDRKAVPKYKQVMEEINRRVKAGELKVGDPVPSINWICKECALSRDTVVKAYENLKKNGVLRAVHGKGFFINSDKALRNEKVILVFDEMNMYKEKIYHAVLDKLTKGFDIEIYFHHNNKKLLKSIIQSAAPKADFIAVIPVSDSIKDHACLLDNEDYRSKRIIWLDRMFAATDYPYVIQDFKQGIYDSLSQGSEFLKKYSQINLLANSVSGEGLIQNIIDGFSSFAKDQGFAFSILPEPEITENHAYITIGDHHLVKIVKDAQEKGFALGRDIGVISYNDTPFKEIIGPGITTISSDFLAMGKTLALMIKNNTTDSAIIKTEMTIRESV